MDIRELPHKVFEQVGHNPEELATFTPGLSDGIKYAKTRQGLWLRLRETTEYVSLSLWGCEEAAKNLSECGSNFFTLYAGTRDGGVWAAGKGSQHVEIAEVRVSQPINIHRPVALDVLHLFVATLELGREDKFELSTFWCAGEGT